MIYRNWKTLIVAAVLSLLLFGAGASGAETNDVMTDLKGLVSRINEKITQGRASETDLSDDIKEFDTLLSKHKGAPSQALVEVMFMKARLYLQVLDNPEAAVEVFKQMKRDFPGMGNAEENIAMLERLVAVRKIQQSLAVGTQFPDFNEKDIAGKPLSMTAFKGKVVLVDFWATWCIGCVLELPNVLKTYEKYHDKGFEVVGISLDDDQKKLQNFVKQRKIIWQQYCDGQAWDSKLAQRYAVTVLPTTYLLDSDGRIIGKDLRGGALEEAVAKALAQK